ncbi:MAG: hypothetical protein R2849_22865 [Thermomicrobiales bacterium]
MEAVIEAWFGRVIPPMAVPGSYTATLEKGGTGADRRVPDPARPANPGVAQDDLVAQYELKADIRDRVSDLNAAVNRIRKVKGQLGNWKDRDAEQFGSDIEELTKSLESVEDARPDRLRRAEARTGPPRWPPRLAGDDGR